MIERECSRGLSEVGNYLMKGGLITSPRDGKFRSTKMALPIQQDQSYHAFISGPFTNESGRLQTIESVNWPIKKW